MYKIPSINLAKKRNNFLDSFIDWALTAGRIIIIVTEAIALLAFLYRFSLDSKLTDLHDKISNNSQRIKLLKNREDTFRGIQTRLALIDQLGARGTQTTTIFTDITKLIPATITTSDVSLTGDTLHISGEAASALLLGTLISNLQAYEHTQNVSLDTITNKTSTGTLSFSVTVLLTVPTSTL